jgi:magnesium transporter
VQSAPAAETAAPKPGDVSPETRGVCVAILPTEKPVRVVGDSPGDFMERLANSTLAWVNFAVDDLKKDAPQVATLMGFNPSLVDALLESQYSNYRDRESEFGIRLPVVKIHGSEFEAEPLLILVRWGLVLSLHERGRVNRMVRLSRYADVFMRKIPSDRAMPDKLTILLTRLLNENNERNFDALRYIQEQGDLISSSLLSESTDRSEVGKQVYAVKHLLVSYLDSLWSTLDVIQSLRYGDAELVSDDETLLARVGILSDDITRQIQLAEHTTEVLVSGLEVLQSVYNNQLQQLNNRLAAVVAWLTILGTVILVPNTIATIFGSITNYSGRPLAFYILGTTGLTLLATFLSWYYVRRQGLIVGEAGRKRSP